MKTMKKKKATLLLLAFLAICLVLPASLTAGKAAAKWPSVVNETVAKAKESIKLVDMSEFKEVVDKKAYDLIIDVREPGEYAQGHVTGAINIPRGLIEFKVWSKVGFPDNTDTDKKIYIYCKTGGRASLATKSLKDLGFTNVTAVNMKIADWKKAGYPMEK
jgi:rhodanese-related sulfurtransferase